MWLEDRVVPEIKVALSTGLTRLLASVTIDAEAEVGVQTSSWVLKLMVLQNAPSPGLFSSMCQATRFTAQTD